MAGRLRKRIWSFEGSFSVVNAGVTVSVNLSCGSRFGSLIRDSANESRYLTVTNSGLEGLALSVNQKSLFVQMPAKSLQMDLEASSRTKAHEVGILNDMLSLRAH